ncbi:hypothetical protein DL765_009432 [Monosporascus sp. GIB2]|nr:hypothetical protein DL765_009432 [Monosporascus sp. GIB2]
MAVYAIPDGQGAMRAYLRDLVAEEPGGGSGAHSPGDLLRCVETDPRERAARLRPRLPRDDGVLERERRRPRRSGPRTRRRRRWGRRGVADAMTEHGLLALVVFPDVAVVLASAPGLPIVTVPMGALEGRGRDAVGPRADGPGDGARVPARHQLRRGQMGRGGAGPGMHTPMSRRRGSGAR